MCGLAKSIARQAMARMSQEGIPECARRGERRDGGKRRGRGIERGQLARTGVDFEQLDALGRVRKGPDDSFQGDGCDVDGLWRLPDARAVDADTLVRGACG
jgi:hypothetical protein